MSVQIPVGFANVSINLRCQGRPRDYAVTFGVQQTSPPVSADGIALLVDGALTSGLAPWATLTNCLDSYQYLGVTCTLMTSTGPVPGSFPNSRAGTAAAGPSPGNVAILVRKFTTRGGKAGRGRMFSPPFNVAEGSIDAAGLMASGTVTALTQQWQAFRSNLVTAGCPMVLLHGPNKAGTPIPPPDPVANLIVENQVATQRRRMRR